MTVENRRKFLEDVDALVNGDRNIDYDEPIIDFAATAEMLTTFFGFKFEPWHVPVIMIIVKLSRIRKSPGKRDHWLDIGGYSVCAEDVLSLRAPSP
jgi:hypothetical protein